MAALLNDSSLNDPWAKICKPCCDPDKNKDGGCDPICMPRCPTVCTHLIYDFPPPYSDADDLSDRSDHPGRPFGVSIFLSVSLAVLATVFVAFCFFSAWRFYRRRRSANRSVRPDPGSDRGPGEESGRVEEERGPWVDHPIWYIRTVGLEAAAIRAITVCKFKKGEGLVEGTECSVCLSEFEEGETLRLLPKCNHAFHIPCIDTWLASHTNCPNCRAGIVRSRVNSGLNTGLPEESEVVIDIANPESEHESELSELESLQGNGMLPLRRSVSVSASMINAFSGESVKSKDEVEPETAEKGGGSSSGSDSEESAVKRSLSCSARVFLSRYSRSRAGSSLPPQ